MNPLKLCGQLEPIMDQSDCIPTTEFSSVPNQPSLIARALRKKMQWNESGF